MNKFKRALAAVLAVVCLTVFSVSSVFAADSPTTGKNQSTTTSTGRYMNWGKNTSVTAKESTKSKSVTTDKIVEQVTISGKTYKVNKIGKYCYNNCKKLKKINVKSKYVTKVHKSAFKGLKKSQLKKIKVVVTKRMSAKNFKALKKALKKVGISTKNITKSKKF